MDCLTAEKMALEIQRYPTGNIRLQVINGKHTHTQCECSGVLQRVLTIILTDTVDPSSFVCRLNHSMDNAAAIPVNHTLQHLAAADGM